MSITKIAKYLLACVFAATFTAHVGYAQSATKEKPAASSEGSASKSSAGETKKEADGKQLPKPLKFSVAAGALNFETSGTWKSVPPKSRMLEYEIKVPHAPDDKRDGRLTIMGAGGSIEANIARWEGQFSQADGSATEAKVTELMVEDMEVTMVDISGTYIETMGGPFSGGKKIENADYRVLAAIIETPSNGNYFVKLIGPKATITANQKNFEDAIKTIKLQE